MTKREKFHINLDKKNNVMTLKHITPQELKRMNSSLIVVKHVNWLNETQSTDIELKGVQLLDLIYATLEQLYHTKEVEHD